MKFVGAIFDTSEGAPEYAVIVRVRDENTTTDIHLSLAEAMILYSDLRKLGVNVGTP